jgi:hypothetical protein
MDWYAIQVITGKEAEVIAALKDYGVNVYLPYRPMFLRRSGNIMRVDRLLMPGYVIARLERVDFYRYKRNLRIEKMMIRLCGNEYDAVPLSNEEISFLNLCCESMTPLVLKKRLVYLEKSINCLGNGVYDIVNPPPWAESTYVEWYDKRQFEAKLHIKSNGVLKDHAFKVAAWCVNESSGTYEEQLKGLMLKDFGRSNVLQQQVFTV